MPLEHFLNLSSYINQKRHYPTPNILFALITTIGPNIDTCEYLIQNLNPDWTSLLLTKLNALRNPPENHIRTIHPHTQILQDNQDIIDPPTTIHDKIYKYIHQNQDPPNLETLSNQFPYLPINFLKETLKIFNPLTEYTHPPPTPPLPLPPQPHYSQNTNYHTQIITWNASSLNTTLPNIQNIISHSHIKPAIITIQETKLTKTKSTKYIQNLFPEYKLVFNNTHTLTRCIQQRIPYTPTRGGLLTLIHKKYAFQGNISKIPSPANISPYIQIIHIKNKSTKAMATTPYVYALTRRRH